MCDTASVQDLLQAPIARSSRVLLVDDAARSRKGMMALLATCPGLQVTGEAANGDEALAQIELNCPDVVVMDARMPRLDVRAATRLIKDRWPEVRVIILSMYALHEDEALAAGADAFLVKGCAPEALFGAILGAPTFRARSPGTSIPPI